MNKRNQYTVMVETKEIRKFSVVASSVEEAAELICSLASALGISKYALSPPSLTSNIEIIHTLFKLDDKFPLYIGKHNNRVFMFFEPNDTELKGMLECWHNKQTELKADKISPEEYDLWKYSFESLSGGDMETNAEHLY